MKERVPHPIPVGRLVINEIEARGWTQADFAVVLGRPVQFVSEIVNGKKEITRESAAQIGAALGPSPEFWLSFQDQFLLSEQAKDLAKQRELSDVRRRAQLNDLVPVAILRKRGVLMGSSLEELEAEIVDLLELESIDRRPKFDFAARRSNVNEPLSPGQYAWVACIKRQARSRQASLGRYAEQQFRELAATLPKLLDGPTAFASLPGLFAAVGVALVYVEALPGAKIDGCAFLLGDIPVIGLSGRGKRLDKILWTLLHEAAHVVLGHVSAKILVEKLDDDEISPDGIETAADHQANGWLLPAPLPSPPVRITAGWLNGIAKERGLAPVVIIGQLQKRGALDWRSNFARNAPNVSGVLAAW